MAWVSDPAREFAYVARSVVCPQPEGWIKTLGLSLIFEEKGLFATKYIPAGTMIGTYSGTEYKDEELKKRMNHPYLLRFTNSTGEEIGIISDSILRFSNHSRTPNMAVRQNKFFTIKDVLKNEELTWNYGGW
ncbi:MAG: SET domain-containing protein-lysine N-methyltransferase [Bdellovibrionales bacterium]